MDLILLHTSCAAANVEDAEDALVETSSSENVSFVAARLHCDSTERPPIIAIMRNTIEHYPC